MDKSQKQKGQKRQAQANTLESIKDIGTSTLSSLKKDVLRPETFMDQIFGPRAPQKFSGEISAGESLEISEVLSGQHEENQKLRRQITLERKLRIDEEAHVEKKVNQLKIQLHAILEEVVVLADQTQNLGSEVQIAAMQAPVEPGVYHLIFFEKLLEFIKSFRKKVEEASVWLHATNRRAQKKNAWGARYKKYGAKYLLSGEHYLSRSAG